MRFSIIMVLMTAFLTGCSDLPNTGNVEPATNKVPEPPPVSKGSSEPVISEEEFAKIPKNLRPESLEQRDDTTVVIRSGKQKTIKEYRINGFLYGIQVIPKVGLPYYLVAADHLGNFINLDKPGMLIPSWTIFEWK